MASSGIAVGGVRHRARVRGQLVRARAHPIGVRLVVGRGRARERRLWPARPRRGLGDPRRPRGCRRLDRDRLHRRSRGGRAALVLDDVGPTGRRQPERGGRRAAGGRRRGRAGRPHRGRPRRRGRRRGGGGRVRRGDGGDDHGSRGVPCGGAVPVRPRLARDGDAHAHDRLRRLSRLSRDRPRGHGWTDRGDRGPRGPVGRPCPDRSRRRGLHGQLRRPRSAAGDRGCPLDSGPAGGGRRAGGAGRRHRVVVLDRRVGPGPRRRELAILRSIGFTGRQIRRSVRTQTVATMIAALVIGVPLGVVVGRVTWRAVRRPARRGARPVVAADVAGAHGRGCAGARPAGGGHPPPGWPRPPVPLSACGSE